MSDLIQPLLFLTLSGLGLGLIIGLVTKIFGVKVDPNIEKLEELLPGANCGGCGYAGCSEFARILASGKAEPNQCPACGDKDLALISDALGIEPLENIKKVALVLCCGNNIESPERALYNGVNDCSSAMLVAGSVKACSYGCLGLASCARACPFNAIEIIDQRIALVHPNICVGCGKCVETCPRNLIKLVPENAECHILCSSRAKAPVQKKTCKVGCIGCRKCLKEAGEDKIKMDLFLATIDYENPPTHEIIDICPVHCIKPTLGMTFAKKTAEKPSLTQDAENSKQAFRDLNLTPEATTLEINDRFKQLTLKHGPKTFKTMSDLEKEEAKDYWKKLTQSYKQALELAKQKEGEKV